MNLFWPKPSFSSIKILIPSPCNGYYPSRISGRAPGRRTGLDSQQPQPCCVNRDVLLPTSLLTFFPTSISRNFFLMSHLLFFIPYLINSWFDLTFKLNLSKWILPNWQENYVRFQETLGISNRDGCLFKRFEFIFPNFAVQEFFAKLRVDSEEFTSNTNKEVQEMCKIKAQQIHLKKGC